MEYIDGPNCYIYCNQNPWSKFDPEGLSEYFRQELSNSCVAATFRNAISRMKDKDITEGYARYRLQQVEKSEFFKGHPELKKNGSGMFENHDWEVKGSAVPFAGTAIKEDYSKTLNVESSNMSPEKIVKEVKESGGSAMVSIPTDGASRHAILVESVETDEKGNSTVSVVDPAKNIDPKDSQKVLPTKMNESEFKKLAKGEKELPAVTVTAKKIEKPEAGKEKK